MVTRSAYGGPRLLLRRLREVMSEPVNAQTRLDKITTTIAGNMVAEVCSVYVLRADGQLELFATEGLNKDSIHTVQMSVGQGLVGTVAQDAEPLSLSNAREDPNFLYFPELGEEVYNAFLGVPILRSGDTLGVLVVQNKAQRVYTEEEIEALETVALVLAELLSSGDLQAIAKPGTTLASKRALHLTGTPLSEALGLGYVVLHTPRVDITKLVADDIGAEITRLDTALHELKASIDDLLDHEDLQRGEQREIMEAYRMFAHDRRWSEKIHEAVETGLTAEAAVEKVQSDIRARMLRAPDAYLRERLHDLDDLANRLLRKLMGEPSKAQLPKDAIIVARNMGPAELLDYGAANVRGLILEEGTPTSHVSIVAKALGIAAVGQVENIVSLVEQGDPIIVDGSSGDVHVRPAPDVEAAYADKVRFRASRLAQYQALRTLEPFTKDKNRIGLYLNAGLIVDLPYLHETNADGIGLFRTELQFMVAEKFPRVEEQRELYRRVLDVAGEKPVVFRSLDVGGDKILPYLPSEVEENPAMGWRAIRLTLDRPALMKTQVRALLLASQGQPLQLLFPMITQVSEIKAARAIVDVECDFLKKQNHTMPSRIEIGAMVEVPAILWQLEELVRHVDFLSVGSNDLMQFIFASDRGNIRLAKRFDHLSVPALRVLKRIVSVANEANLPVTLCGELASRPLEAMAALALGYQKISMSQAAIGPVKAMTHSLDIGAARSFMDDLLGCQDTTRPAREILNEFAAAQSIVLT